MSDWKFNVIHRDTEGNYCISRSVSKYGDSTNVQSGINIETDPRPAGVQFLVQGKIRILDSDGNHCSYAEVGERVAAPSLEIVQKGTGILLTVEDADYYCITDNGVPVNYWDGSFTKLQPNESAVINSVQGKRVFLPEAANIDGIDYPKHTVLRIDSKDSITVTNAGVTNVIATFWRDE